MLVLVLRAGAKRGEHNLLDRMDVMDAIDDSR